VVRTITKNYFPKIQKFLLNTVSSPQALILKERRSMPKDYNPESIPANAIRRREHARDDAWIQEFLKSAQVGHIATRWDDQPFITPISFWYDPKRHSLYFHSNITGRLRANIERHPRACFEASQAGRLLPSNVAQEFSVQYAAVVVFGSIRVLEDPQECRRALTGLIAKYFPGMQPAREYRPITGKELARTTVYEFKIESWSGKENWPDQADQSDDWPALGPEWLKAG
jgi:nitroimidazol reductase NimA-like FMN-containing flavoprotein (pyridoxamine 5'-phosphate oxidase superfamily)